MWTFGGWSCFERNSSEHQRRLLIKHQRLYNLQKLYFIWYKGRGTKGSHLTINVVDNAVKSFKHLVSDRAVFTDYGNAYEVPKESYFSTEDVRLLFETPTSTCFNGSTDSKRLSLNENWKTKQHRTQKSTRITPCVNLEEVGVILGDGRFWTNLWTVNSHPTNRTNCFAYINNFHSFKWRPTNKERYFFQKKRNGLFLYSVNQLWVLNPLDYVNDSQKRTPKTLTVQPNFFLQLTSQS